MSVVAVFPLLFPLSIGGGTIAVAIAAGGRYRTWTDLGVLSLMIAATVPVVAGTFPAAGPVTTRMSAGAQDVQARNLGIVLVALALQWLVDGFAKLVEGARLGAAMLGLPHPWARPDLSAWAG